MYVGCGRQIVQYKMMIFITLLRFSITPLSIAFMAKKWPVPHSSTKCTLQASKQEENSSANKEKLKLTSYSPYR